MDLKRDLTRLARELAYDERKDYDTLPDDEREKYFLAACDVFRERRWGSGEKKAEGA